VYQVTDEAKKLVSTKFAKAGISVVKEGSLSAAVIEKDKLIDNHYYAIANKASLSKPAELNPPLAKQEEFAKKFGITWKAALEKGIVYNAVDGCKRLGIDGDKMDKTWVRDSPRPSVFLDGLGGSSLTHTRAALQGGAKKAGELLKFGGGFYAGRIAAPPKVRFPPCPSFTAARQHVY
jgi:hypothetical protein